MVGGELVDGLPIQEGTMCPSAELQLRVKLMRSGDLTRLVFDVADDDRVLRQVIDEHLPSSSVRSRVRSLFALAAAVVTEEHDEPSTDVT